MSRSRPLLVEPLEDRTVMTTFGVPWPDGEHLRLSFMPDGAAVNGNTSSLFQTLNGVAAPGVWQMAILRAFQTWAASADINIGVVGDGGLPGGTPGALQGDVRFGDIRVAAVPLAGDIALSSPFSVLGGTSAGDLTLNSTATFGVGDPNQIDLYSVALHEAGHILGLADSADPASPMYTYYNGIDVAPTAADIAALQAMYGPRLPDGYEGVNGNGTIASATTMTGPMIADITTLQDADYYRFTVPPLTTSFTVTLQTAGRSLLAGQLSVYNAAGQLVSSAISPAPGGDLTITINDAVPLSTYYFKVQSGSQDVFGVGGYQLYTSTTGPASSAIADDPHTNDLLLTATNLQRKFAQTDQHVDYVTYGRLRDILDTDFYRITAPATQSGQAMVVSVWGLDNTLYPRVNVYDAGGNLQAANVLTNEQGVYAVQLLNPVSNAAYFVQVVSAPAAGNNVGNYGMSVDFRTTPQAMNPAAAGTLSAGNLEAWQTLQANQDQMMHFTLGSGIVCGADTAVELKVYDSNNNVVCTLTTKDGESVSANVFLKAGAYTVRFEGGAQNGALPAVGYQMFVSTLTDPFDPLPVDPNGNPSSPAYQWFFNDSSFYSYLDALDPYSNPWLGY